MTVEEMRKRIEERCGKISCKDCILFKNSEDTCWTNLTDE